MKKTTKSSNPDLKKICKATVEAAHDGGAVLMKHFRKKLRISEKPGAGLVTNADIESQEKIVKLLKRKFPDYGFLTEEADPVLSENPGRWIIDPLDGTTNYVHGYPMFCVSIAAEWEGKVSVGVIYHPVLNETYIAIRKQGAFLNKKKIHVSQTKRLDSALLTTGFTYRKEEYFQTEIAAFTNMSKISRAIRRPGSAALDLAYTACGVFDGFWEQKLSPWDVAAGYLLVTEAGGKVTDLKGNPFKVESSQILASNSKLHTSLLREISIE